MSEQSNSTQLPNPDMQGWHPDLQEHAKRNLARHGLDYLIASKNQLASYEGGWGFFETHSITPDEFQITKDDDLLIDIILNEQPELVKDRKPLSPERRAIAQDGVRRLFEAAWGLDRGDLSNVREARLRLYQLGQPKHAAKKAELYRQGRYVRYQNGPLEGKRYEAFVYGIGSGFLHFGVTNVTASTPDHDKLDTFMRVYIHAKPEYAGHVGAEIVRRMRAKYNKEIYGKILDTSTDDSPGALQREDNLLLYMKTHSEMIAAAAILKELISERPQVFDKNAGRLDRARITDIPFVSIAEEPIQQIGGYQESFNSSRENVEADAQMLLIKKFSEQYPRLDPMRFETMFQYAYKNGFKTKPELKNMYRQAVQYVAPKYGVSQNNYALNKGHVINS